MLAFVYMALSDPQVPEAVRMPIEVLMGVVLVGGVAGAVAYFLFDLRVSRRAPDEAVETARAFEHRVEVRTEERIQREAGHLRDALETTTQQAEQAEQARDALQVQLSELELTVDGSMQQQERLNVELRLERVRAERSQREAEDLRRQLAREQALREELQRAEAVRAEANALRRHELRACDLCLCGGVECELGDGLECGGAQPYFMCSECASYYVGAEVDKFHEFCGRGGRVKCPDPTCNYVFPGRLVSRVLHEEAYDKLKEAERKMVKKEADERWSKEMKALRRRTQEMEGAELHLRQMKMEIEGDVLAPACPKCNVTPELVRDGRPVIEGSGCLAVSCKNCGQHFCGYCFVACANSPEAHEHVGGCRYGHGRGYFPGTYEETVEALNRAHKELREDRLRAYLDRLPPERQPLRNRAVQAVAAVLRQYGLDPAVFNVAEEEMRI